MTAFDAAYRAVSPWPSDPRDPFPQEDATWRQRADEAGIIGTGMPSEEEYLAWLTQGMPDTTEGDLT